MVRYKINSSRSSRSSGGRHASSVHAHLDDVTRTRHFRVFSRRILDLCTGIQLARSDF